MAESYVFWSSLRPNDVSTGQSDVWFDTVAVLLALDDDADALLNFQTLNVSVTDAGETVIASDGSPVKVAVTWKGDGQQTWQHELAVAVSTGKTMGA